MKRLITKIQKLQVKYGFNCIKDMYQGFEFIKFVDKNGIEIVITNFESDYVSTENVNDFDCNDYNYDELPRETLEQILEAFETTILENEKYESVQFYSNI